MSRATDAMSTFYGDMGKRALEVGLASESLSGLLTQHLGSLNMFAGVTDAALQSLAFSKVGDLIPAAHQVQSDRVARMTDELTGRHSRLLGSLNWPEARVASVPDFVTAIPSENLFVHTRAVRVVTSHEQLDDDYEETSRTLNVRVREQTTVSRRAPAALEARIPRAVSGSQDERTGARR